MPAHSSFLTKLNHRAPLSLSLTPNQLILLHFSHLQRSFPASSPYASQEVQRLVPLTPQKLLWVNPGLSRCLGQGTELSLPPPVFLWSPWSLLQAPVLSLELSHLGDLAAPCFRWT